MKSTADDASVGLVEIVSFVNSPSRMGNFIRNARSICRSGSNRLVIFVILIRLYVFRLSFPREDCTIAADSVNLEDTRHSNVLRCIVSRTVFPSEEKYA